MKSVNNSHNNFVKLGREGISEFRNAALTIPFLGTCSHKFHFILTNSQKVTFYVRLSLCVNKNLKIIKKYENN